MCWDEAEDERPTGETSSKRNPPPEEGPATTGDGDATGTGVPDDVDAG